MTGLDPGYPQRGPYEASDGIYPGRGQGKTGDGQEKKKENPLEAGLNSQAVKILRSFEARDIPLGNPEFNQKGSAATAGGAECVSKPFQRLHTNCFDAHAPGQTDPVEVRTPEVK